MTATNAERPLTTYPMDDNTMLVEWARASNASTAEHTSVTYDIVRDGIVVGDLTLSYDYPEKEVWIGSVGLDDDQRNQGIGKRVYSAIPNLPLPRGEGLSEAGFSFLSRHQKPGATRVWESLVRQGLASKGDDGIYRMF